MTTLCPWCLEANSGHAGVCAKCGAPLPGDEEDFVEKLVRFSLKHPVPEVAQFAAEVLGKIGDGRHVRRWKAQRPTIRIRWCGKPRRILSRKPKKETEMLDIKDQHRAHVISTFLTVSRYVEEMEEIATEGKSPSGVGQALSPLPPHAWHAIRASLDRMLRECELIAEAVTPAELEQHRTAAPLCATVTWLSVMLGRIEEALEELRPEVMERKFGKLPEETRRILAGGTDRARSAAGESREALRTTSQQALST